MCELTSRPVPGNLSDMGEQTIKLFDLSEIGSRIIQTRDAYGDKQSEAARKCGIPKNTLSQWESGLRFPNTTYLLKFCDHYNVTLDFILRGRRGGVDQETWERLSRVPPAAE